MTGRAGRLKSKWNSRPHVLTAENERRMKEWMSHKEGR